MKEAVYHNKDAAHRTRPISLRINNTLLAALDEYCRRNPSQNRNHVINKAVRDYLNLKNSYALFDAPWKLDWQWPHRKDTDPDCDIHPNELNFDFD